MYPDFKIGFSKFCELRPKWCITVNSSGTHSVCVCTYHQNAKLMCSFLPDNQYTYENLMKLCVCSLENRNCMFRLCSDCPDRTALSATLVTVFENNDFDIDSTVSYKQWVSTDRSSLVTIENTVNEFVEILTDKIFELCHHHFIKVQQAAYLKETKETLDRETCIVLMDFAEN